MKIVHSRQLCAERTEKHLELLTEPKKSELQQDSWAMLSEIGTRIGSGDKWPDVSQNYQILFPDTILSRTKITSNYWSRLSYIAWREASNIMSAPQKYIFIFCILRHGLNWMDSLLWLSKLTVFFCNFSNIIEFRIRTFLILCHRSPQKMPVRWARMYDICGMERRNASPVNRRNPASIPSHAGLVISSHWISQKKSTLFFFLFMNDPRDWRADQHKTIDHISGIPPFSPGPSQPTFSN